MKNYHSSDVILTEENELKETKNNASAVNETLSIMLKKLHSYQNQLEIQEENLINLQIELAQFRSNYQAVYELTPTPYFTLTEQGVIVDANAAAIKLLNVKKEFLINHSFSRYIESSYQSLFHHCRVAALENKTLQKCEIRLLRKNGAMFYAQLNCKSIPNHTINEKVFLIFLDNLNDKKQTDALNFQINKIEKNSSMEKLTSILAQEMTHPLCIIDNYLQGCIKRLENGSYKPSDLKQALMNASKQTKRATEIILRMKNFTSHRLLQKEWISVNELIEEAVTLIKYEINDLPMTIIYKKNNSFPKVFIDKIHILQVILNLGRNAIEAMRDANTGLPTLKIEINMLNKEEIQFKIIDNGPGVSKEIVNKLFLPNVTTKFYGMGLGLAIAYTLVEAHGGTILYEKVLTGGASFEFVLPIQLGE